MSDGRKEERGVGRVRISLLIMTQVDSLWPVRQISFTLTPRNNCKHGRCLRNHLATLPLFRP